MFHSEETLALFSQEELEDYLKALRREIGKLEYGLRTPSSKFSRRLRDIREGRDPNKENPKRREVYYIRKRKPKTIEEIPQE